MNNQSNSTNILDEQPILQMNHVAKWFGPTCSHCRDSYAELEQNYCPVCHTVYALRDVSLELYAGEILGVVGESGSEKSTLMQIAYFDQTASAGDFRIDHPEIIQSNLLFVSKQRQKWVKHHLLRMVYQNPMLGLRMNFSSISNIAEKMIAANERQVNRIIDRGHELLNVVNIPISRAKEPPKNFSGGMQQRVQIAKALSNEPPILLLDEVTTGLDLSVQTDVLELIKQIQREIGISMIVVSHDLAVIRMLADRTMVMHEGKVIEAGLTDQILEDPQHSFTQKLVYSLL